MRWFWKNKNKYSKNLNSNNKLYNNFFEEIFIDTDDIKIKSNEDMDNCINDEQDSKIIKVGSKVIRKMNKKRKYDHFADLNNREGYIVELKNVSKNFAINRKEIVKILDNVNLSIKKGEFVILYGKSGSGKSTLLNIISGLDRATTGNVIVANMNLPYLSNEELTKFRRYNTSFIFQQYHLLNNITGYENVEMGAILQKDKNKKINVKELFKEFDLVDLMNKYPSQMSGGQQQRISIMRALAKNANIIFADEPTSALDKKTGIEVMELLQKINKQLNTTIIMVSHDLEVVKYANRKISINKGKIIKDEKVSI